MTYLDQERIQARQRVELYRKRFVGESDSFFPIYIALKWQRILDADELDVDGLRGLIDKAHARQDAYKVAYFCFCNHMVAAFRQLVRDQIL